MATTDPSDAAPNPVILSPEGNESVLAVLAEISGSLKDLNAAFKEYPARLLKLEDDRGRDSQRMAEVIDSRYSDWWRSRKRESRRSSRDKSYRASRSIEIASSYDDYMGSDQEEAEEDFIHEKVEYGEFPQKELCEQLFGYFLLSKDDERCSSWLKEKGLVFPRDERYSFSFDSVSLAQERDLDGVQDKIKKIEDFARDLRSNGGFFFFRESYSCCDDEPENGEYIGSRRDKVNKIYNGTHVFRCNDSINKALPKFRKT